MVAIDTNLLKSLYWGQNLSTNEIGKKFGLNGRTIRKKLKKQGIQSKTVSQALTKKFKKDFSGDLSERAYFLGLRAGDFHAKRARKSVRLQTTTTHPAQVELTKKSFSQYGETCVYLMQNQKRQPEWFVYVDLRPSFEFLLDKPRKIELEIFENKECFYQFLAAYSDCESNWNIVKNHKNSVKITFRIRSEDKLILEQIKEKLQGENYSVSFYLERKKGHTNPYGVYSQDFYGIALNRKNDITRLISKLLPLSKHYEKIKQMEFILTSQNKKWHEIKDGLRGIKDNIKQEKLGGNSN